MKFVKFLKENKIITLSLIIVILSFVLLALPGQFAHFVPKHIDPNTYKFYLNGYQWMFGTTKNVLDEAIGPAIGSGIAAFVLLILSFFGLLFSKKSSFVSLLVSLALITVAILFFTVSPATAKAYPDTIFYVSENGDFHNMSWAPYLIGSLTIIAGGLMMYRTVLVLKDEVKRPTQGKGPTYSYLHK